VRHDGRAPDQLRPVRIQLGTNVHAEGACIVEFGRTRVNVTASVEDRVPGHRRGTGSGWVTAEYSMLPRATHDRGSREAIQGRIGGRTHEIQRLIGRSLRAAVDMTKIGERTITLDCDVLQADGGTRTAAITGAYVALSLAVKKLMAEGKLAKNPISNGVAAVSVGVVEGQPLLDLCYTEDVAATVDMNLVMNSEEQFIELQGTGEEACFSQGELESLLALGKGGIRQLLSAQQAALQG